MSAIQLGNRFIHTDSEGFLRDLEDWDEQVALEIARSEGFEDINRERLSILESLRSHYLKHRTFPILASICRKTGNRRRDCVSQEFVNPMSAWKIAGLPKPSNVFFTSFDGGKHYIANPFY